MKKTLFHTFTLIWISSFLFSCSHQKATPSDIQPNPTHPSAQLLAYQQMEIIGFIHFTVNTFTNKEWGFGDESPEIFNPSQLDVEQWVETAKAVGMKELILTAKHHDGFCLWPSKYTEHSIKNSPYQNGKGDIVKDFVEACRRKGLKVGLYLSPWDRNHPDYGKEGYLLYYQNQLIELLTNYGEINEIWFDGANGGDGFYGGANEIRKIDAKTYYHWESIFSLVKELQPDIKIFSDAGPDVHWIGNEQGFAGFTFWSSINADSIIIGNSNTAYLNSGDPEGKNWIVGQCDVSIRPGWFYHQMEDSLVKTPQELLEIYDKSVGRNALMLLNLPPDKRGLIHENDVRTLLDFKSLFDKTFANNLARGATISASNYRFHHEKFDPYHILDENQESYWACDDAISSADLIVVLREEKIFNRILLQEPIRFGQRISKFEIDVLDNGQWKCIFQGTTIGYKRIIHIDKVKASQIRVRILEANNSIALSSFALFESSE